MSFDALDDFAGPGGWDEGARMIGLRTVGLEWDHAACMTAVAAGHARVRADVAAYPSEPFRGIPGYIASPPCQAWSTAGKRKGEADRANCHVLADRMAQGDDSTDWAEWEDPRSPLVCQPVRRVRELRPEWVALEEVPAVRGPWDHFARIFRDWGYSVWVGQLNAADYGVAQVRPREILMASRVDTATPPHPTHSEHGGDSLWGDAGQRWRTIDEALPARRGQWFVSHQNTSVGGGERRAYTIPATRPICTVISSAGGWWADRAHHERSRRGLELVSIRERSVLQSFPADYPWAGTQEQKDRQVGNAVPPLLAAHVLAALTGRELRTEVAA